MNKGVKVTLLIIVVLLIDQVLKIWVKTSMSYGQEIMLIGDWARLHFVENNGMAFGISLGNTWGKLALSLFRILAVIGLAYYIKLLIREKASFGLLASFGLILAGALGNILDSAFYGLIFSESGYHGGLATMFPEGGGEASFLYGRVVDMLYFPMFQGHFPTWFPFWAGEPYLFFRPVFNVADMSITTGVLSIILFHRGFFAAQEETPVDSTSNEILADTNSNGTSNHTEDSTETITKENQSNIEESPSEKEPQ